jgi:hypothetical protein
MMVNHSIMFSCIDTGVLNTLLFVVWVGHGDPQDFGLTSSKGCSNCVLKVFWEAGEDWSKAGWILVLVTTNGYLQSSFYSLFSGLAVPWLCARQAGGLAGQAGFRGG